MELFKFREIQEDDVGHKGLRQELYIKRGGSFFGPAVIQYESKKKRIRTIPTFTGRVPCANRFALEHIGSGKINPRRQGRRSATKQSSK